MYRNWSISIGGNRHEFGPVEVTTWDIGGREYRSDDTDLPRADGRYFGQDFATPGDVTIELIIRASPGTREERFAEVMDIRSEFTRVWNGDDIRYTPGEVAELEIAGRAIVEGRPRHVDWDDSRATFGIIRGTALFVRDFDQSFAVSGSGGDWGEVTVGLVPAQLGGLIAPLVAPLSTAIESTRARPFTVGGEDDVWPIISVQGPLQSGSSVELTHEWSLHLNRALAYDEVATIDTRPGRRSMDINGRTMNLISPTGDRLTNLSIHPGVHEVALRGTSVEGTATVTLRWRETRKVI